MVCLKVGHLTISALVYTANALKQISGLLQHDQRLKILPLGAIDNIRKFKLNYKPMENNRPQCQKHCQSRSDNRNIVKINKVGYRSDSRIIFATSNIQSIRLKELQVSQLISDYSLDFLVLTETWLNSNHDIWKDTCTLSKAQLRLHTANWKEGREQRLSINQHISIPL